MGFIYEDQLNFFQMSKHGKLNGIFYLRDIFINKISYLYIFVIILIQLNK